MALAIPSEAYDHGEVLNTSRRGGVEHGAQRYSTAGADKRVDNVGELSRVLADAEAVLSRAHKVSLMADRIAEHVSGPVPSSTNGTAPTPEPFTLAQKFQSMFARIDAALDQAQGSLQRAAAGL